MKKIAILTICSFNYGNRLQNYALQEILKHLGLSVETLNRQPQTIMYFLKKNFRSLIKRDSRSNFYAFHRKIQWSRDVVSKNKISKNIEKHYDCFVIGSDQIWNIDFDFIGEEDFLPFIRKEKKISYAVSFGIDTIPESERSRIGSYLKQIRSISVREKSGVKIVKELTGQDAFLALDPTLLLSREDWTQLEKKPRKMKKSPYLFTYFLGKNLHENEIQQYAQKHHLQVVDCKKSGLAIGPAEFVYLIHHADMVCTDSFHASVLSFIYKRPFVVFERVSHDQDMSSRIDELCSTFHLENHRFTNANFTWENIGMFDTSADQIWAERRADSLQFLKENLKSIPD